MSDTPITLVVHFRVKPDSVSEALDLFTEHQSNGRSDSGNIRFDVHQDTEDSTRFTSYEVWQSEADIEAHDATDHHAEFIKNLALIQACEKDVQKLRQL